MIEKVKDIADKTNMTMSNVASTLHSQVEKGLPLNLQFFAESNESTNPSEPPEPQEPTDPKEPKGDPEEKTFTQKELEDIVKQRLARAEKDKERAIKEAEKLAKMNADEKREYELEKLQRENEELKAAQSRFELGKEATKMLSESGITATDEILDFVVREDAGATSEAVKSFADLVDKVSDERMKEKLKGNPPKKQPNGQKPITRQDVTKMSYSEHLEFKRNQPELYKQIMNN